MSRKILFYLDLMTIKNNSVTVIGAGLGGSFLTLCLGQMGYKVDVYESRPDYKESNLCNERSFNLTLYYRGVVALKVLNVWNDLKKKAVPVFGKVNHTNSNKPAYYNYGAKGKEVFYSVHRTDLNLILVKKAQKLKNVKFHFGMKCIAIDKYQKQVIFQNTNTQKITTISPNVVFGTDGVNSEVRTAIQSGTNTFHTQEYSGWGYKGIHIDKNLAKKLKLDTNATHKWPKKNSLLIAFPNNDKSFSLMLNLPLYGENSFESLKTKIEVEEFTTSTFPGLLPAISEISYAILNKPVGNLVTVKTDPWFYNDFLLVLGDAAHAVMPFYGQGACAAFEDCIILSKLIKKHEGNWSIIFQKFQKLRKKHTDVLADLSCEMFEDLRNDNYDFYKLIREEIDSVLSRIFPKYWHPSLFKLIAYDDLAYYDAKKLLEKQKKISFFLLLPVIAAVFSIPFRIKQTLRGELTYY